MPVADIGQPDLYRRWLNLLPAIECPHKPRQTFIPIKHKARAPPFGANLIHLDGSNDYA